MRLSLAFAAPSAVTCAPASRCVLDRLTSISNPRPSPSSCTETSRLRRPIPHRSSLSLSSALNAALSTATSSHYLPQPLADTYFAATICRQGIAGPVSCSSYRSARHPLAGGATTRRSCASSSSSWSASDRRTRGMDVSATSNLPSSSSAPATPFQFDSHLHVWASQEEVSQAHCCTVRSCVLAVALVNAYPVAMEAQIS